jgi:hypothetical protein
MQLFDPGITAVSWNELQILRTLHAGLQTSCI